MTIQRFCLRLFIFPCFQKYNKGGREEAGRPAPMSWELFNTYQNDILFEMGKEVQGDK